MFLVKGLVRFRVNEKKQSIIVFSKCLTETRRNEARLCRVRISTMFREERIFRSPSERRIYIRRARKRKKQTKINIDGENRRFSTLKFKRAKAKAGNKFLPFVYQFFFCLWLCLNMAAFLIKQWSYGATPACTPPCACPFPRLLPSRSRQTTRCCARNGKGRQARDKYPSKGWFPTCLHGRSRRT